MIDESKIKNIRPQLMEAIKEDDWDKFWGLISRAVTNGAIAFLTQMAEKNPESMHDLCEFRVPLQMSMDEDIPVKVCSVGGQMHFGLLGILNGIVCTILDSNRLIAGGYDENGRLNGFSDHIVNRGKDER